MTDRFGHQLALGRCPRCQYSELMTSINSDAKVCTNRFCRFTITGRELAMNKDSGQLLEYLKEKAKTHKRPDLREAIRETREAES